MATDYTDVATTPTPPPAPPKDTKKPSPLDTLKSIVTHPGEFTAGVGKGAGDALQNTRRALMPALLPAARVAGNIMHSGVDSMNAVFGTPMRAAQAAITTTSTEKDPAANLRRSAETALAGPLAIAADPHNWPLLHSMVHAATHPDEATSIQTNAENATHVNKLLSKNTHTNDPAIARTIEAIGSTTGPAGQALAKLANIIPASHLQDFAVHTGFGLATDPLTVAGGPVKDVGESLMTHAIGPAYDAAVKKLLTGGGGKALQGIAETVATNPAERAAGIAAPKIAAANRVVNLMKNKGARQGLTHSEITDSIKNVLTGNLGYDKKLAEQVVASARSDSALGLRSLSKAQTKMMILTGIPHVKNVGVALFMADGERGVGRAVQFATTGIPPRLDKLLKRGAEAHFDTPGHYPPGLQQLHEASGKMLQSWDRAARASHLEALMKRYPKEDMNVLLNRVNQDIGEYGTTTKAVQGSKAIGGNFPQWHVGNVPGMFGRASVRNPGAMHRLFMGEQNANDYLIQDPQNQYGLGGPGDEGAKAVTNPVNYLWGPSTAGVLPTVANIAGATSKLASGKPAEAKGFLKTAGQDAAEYFSGFIPFGGLIEEAIEKQNPVAGTVMGTAAISSQKRSPAQKRRLAKAQGQAEQAPSQPVSSGPKDYTNP